MDRNKPGEYDLEELNKFARIIGGNFYGWRKWLQNCSQKYLPINRFSEKAVKGDDRADGHLPTKSDMDRLLHDIRMIPPASELLWDYLYDETGQRLVEVSDGKGFVAFMSEELFNRLGLNEKRQQ